MSWETYARNLLLERVEKYLGEDNYYLDNIEEMFWDAWDGSEYHCLAHVYMVANTALELAHRLDLGPVEMHAVVVAGIFHDMGRRPIDDSKNIYLAKWLAEKHIDKEMMFVDEMEKEYFKFLVNTGIEGTLFPPSEPITHVVGKILRDADFASLIAPDEIYQEACQALYLETGTAASYAFVISQGALLEVTVDYYDEHGLDIELKEG